MGKATVKRKYLGVRLAAWSISASLSVVRELSAACAVHAVRLTIEVRTRRFPMPAPAAWREGQVKSGPLDEEPRSPRS